MRIALLTLTALALSPAHATSAQKPSGEIPMHIVAQGHARPDVAVFQGTIWGHGKSRAEAEADRKSKEQNVLEKLNKLGLPGEAVTTQPQEQLTDPQEFASDVIEIDVDDSPEPRETAASKISVTLVDLTKTADVLALLLASQVSIHSRYPTYKISDPAKARSKALDGAIANARADAEIYAARMGYHIVRMTGFGVVKNPLNIPDIFNAWGHQTFNFARGRSFMLSDSTTYVSVEIDYIIAPN